MLLLLEKAYRLTWTAYALDRKDPNMQMVCVAVTVDAMNRTGFVQSD